MELEEGRNISQLQYVLKLAHSHEVADQQKVLDTCARTVLDRRRGGKPAGLGGD
jgi:hypothetical protein